jgi:hypothetical protein
MEVSITLHLNCVYELSAFNNIIHDRFISVVLKRCMPRFILSSFIIGAPLLNILCDFPSH